MKQNAGNIDRIIRVVIGLVLLAFAWTSWGDTGSAMTWIAAIAGIVALFTGVIGWCALYTIFGINTCKNKE